MLFSLWPLTQPFLPPFSLRLLLFLKVLSFFFSFLARQLHCLFFSLYSRRAWCLTVVFGAGALSHVFQSYWEGECVCDIDPGFSQWDGCVEWLIGARRVTWDKANIPSYSSRSYSATLTGALVYELCYTVCHAWEDRRGCGDGLTLRLPQGSRCCRKS